MKKFIYFLFIIVTGLVLTACSAKGGESTDSYKVEMHDRAGSAGESRHVEPELADGSVASDLENMKTTQMTDEGHTERKVMYSASINVEVKDYTQSVENITKKVNEWSGYVVSSTMYGEPGSVFGDITVRLPQEHFQSFLTFIDEETHKVIDKSISGEDVTEEYVDLESRLKSKRAVESRLLDFMEQAETTEELLAISKDLAEVQEEIETILGRMNYLDNRVEYAIVTIHLAETNVKVPNLGDDELNTWEKTKETFMKSLKFLMQLFSGIIVFLIGGLPIIIVISIILLIILLFYKRTRKRKKEERDGQND